MPRKKKKSQKSRASDKQQKIKGDMPKLKASIPDLSNTISMVSEASKKLHLAVEDSGILKTTLPDLNSAISTVAEVSRGLTLAIEDPGILRTFNKVLDLQSSIGQQAIELQKKSTLFSDQANQTLQNITGPISGAITDIGMSVVSAQKSFETGLINLEAFQAAQNVSSLCLSTLERKQNTVLSDLLNIKKVQDFIVLAEGTVPSLKMISGGISELTLSSPVVSHDLSLPSLTVVHSETSITEEETRECQRKLDDMLSKIDEELVLYRQGCWDTFFARGKDYIGQSSSSMRRLVDGLLHIVAPKEKVMKTDYFKSSRDAKKDDKPTRKARIYYLLGYDKNSANRFKRLAKGFLEAYGNLPAWDHQPLKSHNFVHGVFITIEGYLLSLLTEWFKGN